MRYLRTASPHASYSLSFSFQSDRRSFHFRFGRRVSLRVLDGVAHRRVATPEKRELVAHGANDNRDLATQPGIQSSILRP
jgi:hypothetical protein